MAGGRGARCGEEKQQQRPRAGPFRPRLNPTELCKLDCRSRIVKSQLLKAELKACLDTEAVGANERLVTHLQSIFFISLCHQRQALSLRIGSSLVPPPPVPI